jgi:hypothetical protein
MDQTATLPTYSTVPGFDWLSTDMIADDANPDLKAFFFSSSFTTPETNQRPIFPNTYREWLLHRFADEVRVTEETLTAMEIPNKVDRLDSLTNCRTHAHFARNKISGEVRVLSSACHQRWCVLCASAKAYQISEQVVTWLKAVKNPRFLTLTLPHSAAGLSFQIDCLYTYFKNFRRHKLVKRALLAGLWFFQVTFNAETQKWHPHLHVLLVGEYMEQKKLLLVWNAITHGAKHLDIQAVKDPEGIGQYAARYVSRPAMLSKLPADRREEVITAFHGRRLMGTWGSEKLKPKIEKKKVNREDWETLGSWQYVCRMREINPAAKAIWKAWQKNEALAVGVTCETPPPPRPEPSPAADRPRGPTPQPLLFDTSCSPNFKAF